MKTEDAVAVCQLSKQLEYELTVIQTEEQIRKVISRNDHVAFVASISEANVTGWIHAFLAYYLESLPFVEIGGLIVDEAYRGKGIGKALINEVKGWCMEQSVHRLRVRTQTKRFNAQRFYTSFGFKEIKEQKVYQLDLLLNEDNNQA